MAIPRVPLLLALGFVTATLVGPAHSAAATPIVESPPESVDLAAVTLTNAKVSKPLPAVLPDGPVLVHFWATWCVPCRRELPAIDRLMGDPAAEAISDRLVLVSVDRFAYDRVAAFLGDDLGLALHSWQDASRTAGRTFRLFGYPSTVLLDADHRIVWRHSGPVDWDDPATRQALADRLTGKTGLDDQ